MAWMRVAWLVLSVPHGLSPLFAADPRELRGIIRKIEDFEDEQSEKLGEVRISRARDRVRTAEELVRDARERAAAARMKCLVAKSCLRGGASVLKVSKSAPEQRASLAQLVEEWKSSQKALDVLEKPIIAKLRRSKEYQEAEADADRALKELVRVRGAPAANVVTTNGDTVEQSLRKRVARPQEMEASAIDADPFAQAARREVVRLKDRIADCRNEVAFDFRNHLASLDGEGRMAWAQQMAHKANRAEIDARRDVDIAVAKLEHAERQLVLEIELHRDETENRQN